MTSDNSRKVLNIDVQNSFNLIIPFEKFGSVEPAMTFVNYSCIPNMVDTLKPSIIIGFKDHDNKDIKRVICYHSEEERDRVYNTICKEYKDYFNHL